MKRIILCIIALPLAVWLIFLLIPRTNRYQYDCTLNAEYEYPQMERLFGGAVHITADLQTTIIFNRMYISGEVTIQNKKYNVSEKQYVPRSLLARLDHSLEAVATMTPDYFNTFWLDFNFTEPELEEYDMQIDMFLSRNRISLYVSKIEDRTRALAYYSGCLE